MNWTYMFISIFILLTVLFWVTDISKNEKFMKYISVLSVITTLIFIISFVNNIKNTEKQIDDKKATDFINETEKNWIELEKYFSNNFPYLSPLYKELYADNQTIQPISLSPDQQTEANYKQLHACQILYQTIENLVNTEPELTYDRLNFGWYKIFSSWSKSDIFRSNWESSKSFYNPTTQNFISSLINRNATETKGSME